MEFSSVKKHCDDTSVNEQPHKEWDDLFRPNVAPAEKVSELINQNTNQWDMQKLAANFCQVDIEYIVQIPFSI
jgi:hypothetical protein